MRNYYYYYFTHDTNRLLQAFNECSWEHPLSEAALLVLAGQKAREQDKTQFQSGGVKVGLEEEQEPITAQGIKRCLLLTREEYKDTTD